MGPRIEIRGDARAAAAPISVTWLQWGRGSRSAETQHTPRATAGRPRFNGAADRDPRRHRVGPRGRPRNHASMGPRIEIRGDVEVTRIHSADDLASMGPRIEIRGDVYLCDVCYRWLLLQWGRGSRSAETPFLAGTDRRAQPASMGPRIEIRGDLDGRRLVCRLSVLQWGRGSRSAETPRTQMTARSRHQGFNGAADRDPRRRFEFEKPSHCILWASMGPRIEIRGDARS